MVQETWVQSKVASYEKLLKWYLILPCLTLSNIRYVSRVKWSNPGKGVAPSLTPRCSSYWKGSLLVALDYGRWLYFFKNQKNSELSICSNTYKLYCIFVCKTLEFCFLKCHFDPKHCDPKILWSSTPVPIYIEIILKNCMNKSVG